MVLVRCGWLRAAAASKRALAARSGLLTAKPGLLADSRPGLPTDTPPGLLAGMSGPQTARPGLLAGGSGLPTAMLCLQRRACARTYTQPTLPLAAGAQLSAPHPIWRFLHVSRRAILDLALMLRCLRSSINPSPQVHAARCAYFGVVASSKPESIGPKVL